MNINIKPKLITDKIYKKLLKNEFKKKTYSNNIINYSKEILLNNWYILIILSFVFFILYLRFKENKNKKNIKETEKLNNTENIDHTENIDNKLNSENKILINESTDDFLNNYQNIDRVIPKFIDRNYHQ